jgi:hypothetical protein
MDEADIDWLRTTVYQLLALQRSLQYRLLDCDVVLIRVRVRVRGVGEDIPFKLLEV